MGSPELELHTRTGFHGWKLVSLVLVALVYGSALLVSSVDALLKTHRDLKTFQHLPAFDTSNIRGQQAITPVQFLGGNGKIPLTFNAARNGTFSPVSRTIQWIQSPDSLTNDSGTFVVSDTSSYVVKSISDPSYSQTIFEGSHVTYNNEQYKIEDIIASDNLKFALIVSDKKHNWRHSFFANYWIYNVEDRSVQPLYDPSPELNSKIALASWAPNSDKVAFVLENNVYFKDVSDFYHPKLTQVTFDGGAQIFYGKPDWVYEEEVFESDSAMWWSPNGSYLAILRSNDTEVPVFPIPYFVQSEDQAYPDLREIKYPKAGFPNPKVDVIVYDFAEGQVRKLDGSDAFYNDPEVSNDDRLITEIMWVGDDKFLARVTNRESDLLKIFIVNAEKMVSKLTRSEKSNGSWFEITHSTLYVPANEEHGRPYDGYIDTIDVDGYDHLAYYSPATATKPTILTSGEWEVVSAPSSFDHLTNTVFFIATKKSSVERHLYSVDLHGEKFENLTDVSREGWYDVSFSSGSRFVLLNYEGPEIPHQKLLDLKTGSEQLLESNQKLANTLTLYDVPTVRYGTVDLSSEDEDPILANYVETLPLNFDETKEYPVLFFVYGGPGSQLVQKQFGISFSASIAAEIGAVVVTVDGRGTGFKGSKYRSVVRDQLGHYETIDQIAAAKIWKQKSYIDPSRVAIWGWSYGGFMTLKTLERDAGETFKYGMSVAPVTDWRFYDSIYTERYMHTPQQNPNYSTSSVVNVKNIAKSKRFLLMHGSGDDNVHFQNSLKFLDLLDQASIENYDVHVFPDSDHSISYHNAHVIVYDKLFLWIKQAFEGDYDDVITFGPFDAEINLYG